MNPTSPSRRSPSPTPSTSSAQQQIEPFAIQIADSYFWNLSEDIYFPIYPRLLNVQFREKINELLKQLEVNLQNTMACLSKVSSFPLTNNAEIVCTLVAFLCYNFPKTVPLSLLTSPIALAAIRPLSRSLSPEDQETASQELCIAMNGLTTISTQIITCMSQGIELQHLRTMNRQQENCQRAVMSAISRRIFHDRPLSTQEATSLPELMTLCDEDESCRVGRTSKALLVSMISAINLSCDEKSKKLKFELLIECVREVSQAKELLISQSCHYFLRNNLDLPTTGEDLLAACNQHCAINLLVPVQLQTLLSWNNEIFCCLARIFLRDKPTLLNQPTIIPANADARWFVSAVRPHLRSGRKTLWPSKRLTCALIQALKSSPQESEATTSSAASQASAACVDLNVGCSRFFRSVTVLNSLLRILFTLDTNNDLSPATIELFQGYIQARLLENSDFTESHKEIILASSAMCFEQASQFEPTD